MGMLPNKLKEEVELKPIPTRKAIKTYQAEIRKPTYETESTRDWTSLKLSASEYVYHKHPMIDQTTQM